MPELVISLIRGSSVAPILIVVYASLFVFVPILAYSILTQRWEVWRESWSMPRLNPMTLAAFAGCLLIYGGTMLGMRRDPSHIMQVLLNALTPVRLCAAAVVAITEEFCMRGFVLGEAQRYIKFWLANIVQATVFAAAHIGPMIAIHATPFRTFEVVGYIFVFALVLGALRQASGSLWLPIAAHMIFDIR